MRLINRRVESGKERDAPALPWRGIRHRGRTQGIGVKWAWVNDQERIKKLHIPEPTPGVRIIEGEQLLESSETGVHIPHFSVSQGLPTMLL